MTKRFLNIFIGSGIIKLDLKCQTYEPNSLIQSQGVIQPNKTGKDIIPKLNYSLDRCVFSNNNLKFKDVILDWPIFHVVKQASDLKYSSHKVNEI